MITFEQAARWLGSLDRELAAGIVGGESVALTEQESQQEQKLRERASALGESLPLDTLVQSASLDAFEIETLLFCAAAEFDARYGSLYGFLQDDTSRRRPSVGLLASITATSLSELPARRRALGRLGKLRRYQLLRACSAPGEIDEGLVLAPRVLDALLGTARLVPRDPLELQPPSTRSPIIDAKIENLARAVRADAAAIVAIWGARAADARALVHALATRLNMRARILPASSGEDATHALAEASADAEALGQLLWIDCALFERSPHVLEALLHGRSPVCLTGREPTCPASLLATRRFTEIHAVPPTYSARRDAWLDAFEEIGAERAGDLAARYRLDATELAAIANTARTAAIVASNGHAASATDFVESACAMLVHARSRQLSKVVTPRRGLADLVLAPELERQVIELVQAFRAWPRIVETWGLERAAAGGLKALFAGEPGTGKTLAAEVIAKELGLALVKIDLAQVVSKWVGETEKNLDIVFDEADHGNAVLFFDEAEALFGKRGEVRHGTDRYANLEVSYLLQRLEAHDGLVLLASNLKGEIDDAFTRRFHSVLYFARPGEVERRRLWQLGLPPSVPLCDDVDIGLLAKLELTGAGIVAAVRSAALRAAQAAAPHISAADLVFGIARQFQRESRLLTPTDLGRYGAHLFS